MAANWFAYRRTAVLTAYSAVARWVRISARIWFSRALSLRMPRPKLKIPPICLPCSPVAVSRRAVSSAALVPSASSNRSTSRGGLGRVDDVPLRDDQVLGVRARRPC